MEVVVVVVVLELDRHRPQTAELPVRAFDPLPDVVTRRIGRVGMLRVPRHMQGSCPDVRDVPVELEQEPVGELREVVVTDRHLLPSRVRGVADEVREPVAREDPDHDADRLRPRRGRRTVERPDREAVLGIRLKGVEPHRSLGAGRRGDDVRGTGARGITDLEAGRISIVVPRDADVRRRHQRGRDVDRSDRRVAR